MKNYPQTFFKDAWKGGPCMSFLSAWDLWDLSIAHIGVEITDSPYVVCNMRIMTRMGKKVLEVLGQRAFCSLPAFCRNASASQAKRMCPGLVTHRINILSIFPKSVKSGLMAAAMEAMLFLGKKCFALRIASVMARDEGWLAEHMLILGITNPEGKKNILPLLFPVLVEKQI